MYEQKQSKPVQRLREKGLILTIGLRVWKAKLKISTDRVLKYGLFIKLY